MRNADEIFNEAIKQSISPSGLVTQETALKVRNLMFETVRIARIELLESLLLKEESIYDLNLISTSYIKELLKQLEK